MSKTRISAATFSKRVARAGWPAVILAVSWSGCGTPGEPLPPLLNLPARTTDLEAVQRGNELVLGWTAPAQTSEGLPLRKLDRIVVWAAELEQDDPAAALEGARRRPLATLPAGHTPGEKTELRLPLPAATGKRVALAVENLTRGGRAAGLSNIVVLEMGVALAAPRALRAVAQSNAIRLEWPEVAGAGGYRVFRSVEAKAPFTPVGEAAASPFEDADFRWGVRYGYFVRAFVATSTGTAESADSPLADIVPQDRFPPSPPAGLQAIATQSAIELSWLPSPEPDVAGYHVYRRIGSGEWTRLTAEAAAAPAFSDKNIERDQPYSYAVSSVDQKGNESDRSAAVDARAL